MDCNVLEYIDWLMDQGMDEDAACEEAASAFDAGRENEHESCSYL